MVLLFDDVHDVARENHSTIRVEGDSLHFCGGFDGLGEVRAGLVEICCRIDDVSAELADAFASNS